jgi:cytosine/adenosine deaminase-related metal-dependent hydrolase
MMNCPSTDASRNTASLRIVDRPEARAWRGDLVLCDVTVDERGRIDVRIAHGVVVETGPTIEAPDVPELRGNAVLPGLHDHHLHLLGMAVARRSVGCGPAAVLAEFLR